MTRRTKLALVAAVVTAAALVAVPATGATLPARLDINHGVMPKQAQETATPASQASLDYNGGPVISNAEVTSVAWGSPGAYGPLGGFFGGILRSSYMSWLKEYDTTLPGGTGQHIGYGTFHSAVTLGTGVVGSATTIDDSTIQSTLLAQVTNGTLPPPTTDAGGNVNTIYAVFFPHGDTITVEGHSSGSYFCAYHGATTDTYNGNHLLYLVLPDPTTGEMATGCGSHTDPVDNLESYASHELIETITDPLVSLASAAAPPLAWYDNTNDAEIADICGTDGTVAGGDGDGDGVDYTVQKLWSNSFGDCIVQRTATLPSKPLNPTASTLSRGRVRVSWRAPLDDGYAPVQGYDVYRAVPGRAAHLAGQTDGSQYVDTPATDGAYIYTIRATNSAGTGPPSVQLTASADGTKPTISMSAPSSLFSLASSATTKYVGTDAGAGVATYDVSYRLAKWNGGFGSAVKPSSWQHTTARQKTLSTSQGHEYCFSAVARDGAGNLSNASTQHCQVAPLDERSMSRSAHWSTSSSSSAYRHTLTSTTTQGATLTLKNVRAHRIALVLQTCSKCGRVKVYVGKTLVATINTHSATTKNKVIKILSAFSLRTANVRLVAADAGKRVVVDGLGVSLT